MNIDDLTIGQAKLLAEIFGKSAHESPKTPHIGKACIVRTYASGVFFAVVVDQNGRQVEMKNARRLWRFDCEKGIDCTAVAMHGSTGERARTCEAVPGMTVLDALEIIPCSVSAAKQLTEAPNATPD